ncbi:MAG: HD domain-containing protein [Erysipelotrichaceae bacterium]|jgi:3'-5' exoribonuclease|nr:HD domain-containing protein [Bacillota bacterium]MDY0118575.1 HD domain-containing protein [Bacilli bacterium]NLJ32575.1 HD domain-containing protein [Erysipelotrichaceae bacterium]
MIKIKDLNPGIRIYEKLLVINATKGVTNNGNLYLNILLQDNTGQIEAKLWDATPYDEENLVPGNIVELVADVLDYRGSLQLKIIEHKLVDPSNVDLANFVMSSEIAIEDLEKELTKVLKSIKDKEVSAIVTHLVNKYYDEFIHYPAATRNHHEYLGGLLEHTLSMVKIADLLFSHYQDIDRDILVGGILLHDLGKTIELSGPVVTRYTVEGRLVGHISLGSAEIFKAAEELKITSEVPVLLSHLVLSHHGKMEFGSPVVPMTKEAFILSLIDNLDSKLKIIDKALEITEEGEFTDRIWALDNISLYKPLKRK